MKIGFVCDYYYPFEVSGAEVSSRLLAENLQFKGIDFVVVTPNFGNRNEEEINKVKIKRFPFLKREKTTALPPRVVDNPLWFLYAAFWIWKNLKDESVNVLQVQNKNMVIAASLANIFLRKPLIINVRDYRLLCDLGVCLMDGQDKICGVKKYLTFDIPKYIRQFRKQGIAVPYQYLVGFYELFIREINKYFLNKASKVVCLSLNQQKIYQGAGIRNTTKIFNPINLEGFDKKDSKLREKIILFVGRYTFGKGKQLLDKVIPQFLNRHKDWKFVVLSKSKIDIKCVRLEHIEVLPYAQFRQFMARSSLCVIPSVWPEPLSRTALDALSLGTPIIASNRGSMEEIVIDGKYGYVSNINESDFLEAIEKGIKNRSLLNRNIYRDKKKLEVRFFDEPLKAYIKLYQNLQ